MEPKILIVDDDEHILKSLEIYLKIENFNVLTALSGMEALEKLKLEIPDIIILDIMMPEMDGFEVLEKIKSDPATRDIPVIMLTAKGQDIDVLRGYQKGAASYITKPFNLNELVDNVRLLLESVRAQAKKKIYEI